MATPRRLEEAQRASAAYGVALNALGAQATVEALRIWEEVPVSSSPNVGSWLNRIISVLLPIRRKTRHLARTYYRLNRALLTETTIQDDVGTVEETTSLGDLRKQFSDSYKDAVRPSAGRSALTPPPGQPSPPEPVSEPQEDDEDTILVEEIRALEQEAERIEQEAEDELRSALEALGTSNLQRKLDEIDDSLPASVVDDLRRKAHDEAGARQGAAAGRVIRNGGRSDVWTAAERDRKALGYIRLSRTGTPCGWCAMLISRGAVYRTAGSAQFSDGDLYHDNCNCYTEPIFDSEQYNNSPLYALNREYARLWPEVTRGLSGKAAVSAWRRFIRNRAQAAQQ